MNLEDIIEIKKDLAKKVFVVDNYVVINVEFEYNIELSRCNTSEKLLWWVWHLTKKNWMTNDVLRKFIEVVCEINLITLPHGV